MEKLIVTRHPALVEVLKEDFGIEGEVLSHVSDPSVLKGRDVYGVLPVNLAAECRSFTMLALNLPPELRGVELDAAQVREHLEGVETYVVLTRVRWNELAEFTNHVANGVVMKEI